MTFSRAGIFGGARSPSGKGLAQALDVKAMVVRPPEGAFAHDVQAVQSIPAVPTILEVVCRTTGMGFAAVARVTDERWIACGVSDLIEFGLAPGGELEVASTICNEIRDHHRPVVIDDVAQDADFRGHHTPARYGFKSYASFPIVLPSGRFFGTLCAIDPHPRRLKTPEVVGMFTLFAELIAFHLDAYERLAASAADLLDERRTAELREQFIAVVGHDLRNPLASIDAGATLLARQPLDAKGERIVGMMRASVGRMSGLIDNVLDFARGRLGGGVTLNRSACALKPALQQVVDELRASHPDRTIAADLRLDEAIDCDPGRLSQLLSNLLGNAITHGAADQPVRVDAAVEAGELVMTVANGGEPIPPATLSKLFQPFERGAVRPSLQGLGLGLYISSEIARAHGGTLSVESGPEETVFTFRMPLSYLRAGDRLTLRRP